MNKHDRLNFITWRKVTRAKSDRILSIKAFWDNGVVNLIYYFDGIVTDEDRELASELSTKIIADFLDATLEEKYIAWDKSKPVPEDNIAYKKEEGWKPPSLRHL